MRLKELLFVLTVMFGILPVSAAKVKIIMNDTSKTMSLTSVETGEAIDAGIPTATTYELDITPGNYLLTAFDTDGTTVNGTIELTVGDVDAEQEFKIITSTFYVRNKDEQGKVWSIEDGDYTAALKVNTRNNIVINSKYGKSKTAHRYTFLALNGDSYMLTLTPSEKHASEGYTTLFRGGTLTRNIDVGCDIPKGDYFSLSVPEGAKFQLGLKFAHFTDFSIVEPYKTEIKGDTKTLTYYLAENGQYNYRTWITGGLTQAGFFDFSSDKAARPDMEFTMADYRSQSPKTINHDVQSNKGYETGDIFLNINERGHLSMNVGDTFSAHAMRTWELTNNFSGNYFIEPDFHYSVIDLDGKPSEGVIEITQKEGSAWAEIRAVGEGTAIVLVSYDAIAVNYYDGAEKRPYMGGDFWGAIWPENTGVYVVTVGETASMAIPNMTINEDYNKAALKMAGEYVDAEHDVFYYLDTEEGACYTFTPENVNDVSIAYPSINESAATYSGFSRDGVTFNEDGSFTLLLKEGRQIIRLTDHAGNSAYQVITAKKCHREITNETHPESKTFMPGDKVKIQYSGLRHPANKLAGIYNMSAYITYNNIPNGSSLILGSGQYTFGSSASAQALSVTIPENYDIASQPYILMDEGVIQVNGYGDPVGNHRLIDPEAGRSPNFTAVAHKTYFGRLPEVKIPIGVSTGIDSTNVDSAAPVLYYNLQGVESTTPFKGLNIVRFSDGTARKVVIP